MSDSDDVISINVIVTSSNIENKEYICNENECETRQFQSEQSLKKHLLLQHHNISVAPDKSPKIIYRFHCPIKSCRRANLNSRDYFVTRKHLTQHFFKVHNTQKFQCQKCKIKKFSTELLRNLHQKNCGKIFTCAICNCSYNSNEAFLTHTKRKNHYSNETEIKSRSPVIKKVKRSDHPLSTRTVSTTTSGLGLWNSTENLSSASGETKTTSVFTSTDHPITSTILETKSTITEDILLGSSSSSHQIVTKLIKNSSTSTEDFTKEENSNSCLSSSSSQHKKNVNWSVTGGDFEDSINLFDSDVKMEFYSAETQTDFSVNLFNNNYTQTTFADFDDFEKFDNQTQTNWDESNQGF